MVTNNIVASAAVLSPIGCEDSDAFAKSLLAPSNVYESRELIASGTDHQSQDSLWSETLHESNYFIGSGTASQSKNLPLSHLFAVNDAFLRPSESKVPARAVGKRVGSLSGGLIVLIGGVLALLIVVSAVIVFRMLKNREDKVEEVSGGCVERFEGSLFDLSQFVFSDFRVE
jgi:hypothetical protein